MRTIATAPATCADTPLARDALAGCHRLALLALARPGMQDWAEQRRQAQWHMERLAACLERDDALATLAPRGSARRKHR